MAKIKKTLGGERLGSGKKMKVSLHGYGRSNNDISRYFKTDQAVGTLVPYFVDVATNGTDYYIDLTTKVRTLPTNGPIFGAFKHQIDVFSIPIRLYNAQLHNNALKIGLDMSKVILPTETFRVQKVDPKRGDMNKQQISQDSLMAYLGIRGLGRKTVEESTIVTRDFPAIFHLAYWDIYKNYYANKQETEAYAIGPTQSFSYIAIDEITVTNYFKSFETGECQEVKEYQTSTDTIGLLQGGFTIRTPKGSTAICNPGVLEIQIKNPGTEQISLEEFEDYGIYDPVRQEYVYPGDLFATVETMPANKTGYSRFRLTALIRYGEISYTSSTSFMRTTTSEKTEIGKFPLENIDKMREALLRQDKGSAFSVSGMNMAPYNYSSGWFKTDNPSEATGNGAFFNQSGLGLRTYLSDRFNNWLSEEWIEGVKGVNEISAIEVVDGKISIDSLILKKKVYDMLNRVAMGDGTYHDWQEVMYGRKITFIPESPVFQGGMSSEITFDEVVSSAETGDQPLGTLAGRGSDKMFKGGKQIHVHIEEPSILMIIGSIVPRVTYSQGNKWYMELKTMNDLHKPALDQIGFQNLTTEEFAAWDTIVNEDGTTTKHSVGKQPAWTELTTNVDESFGSFSYDEALQHMSINRGYTADENGDIQDATTYIEPTMYNTAFADARLSAKNFWVQCQIDCMARRVKSAAVIPVL